MTSPQPHIPVMLNEVIESLNLKPNSIVVDGTFGAGGYSSAILNRMSCQLYAIDRDPHSHPYADRLLSQFSSHFTFISGCFGSMTSLLSPYKVDHVDAIVLDLGISSMQIDQADRGFSFSHDGPLDMRMSQTGPNAADLVNQLTETELANILYTYGEERHSRRLAKAIVLARQNEKFTRTHQLADLIRHHSRRSKDGLDPATRTFQALRIVVNNELGELQNGLESAEKLLLPGGRLVVVSFHSLEDRLVKNFLSTRSQSGSKTSRHRPSIPLPHPSFRLISKKPSQAQDSEILRNPRSRSAKLRWAERTQAEPWTDPLQKSHKGGVS